MVEGTLIEQGREHRVVVTYYDERPVSVPTAGGGSYWQRPRADAKLANVQGPSLGLPTTACSLRIGQETFAFCPSRLATTGGIDGWVQHPS